MTPNMAADRLSWTDMDNIDRIRRAHAQKHTSGTQTSASHSFLKKTKKPSHKWCYLHIFPGKYLQISHTLQNCYRHV